MAATLGQPVQVTHLAWSAVSGTNVLAINPACGKLGPALAQRWHQAATPRSPQSFAGPLSAGLVSVGIPPVYFTVLGHKKPPAWPFRNPWVL